jgi:hypothetical protein
MLYLERAHTETSLGTPRCHEEIAVVLVLLSVCREPPLMLKHGCARGCVGDLTGGSPRLHFHVPIVLIETYVMVLSP